MMNTRNLSVKAKTVEKLNIWKAEIHNSQYRPYLTVRSVNKIGRRHWMYCSKQKRQVHLLSDGERRAYTILLSMPETKAVMEQYALDSNETMDIAIEQGVIHPRNHKTGEAHVMTTDFVVTQNVPNQFGVYATAYTFKYFDQLYTLEGDTRKPKSYRTWEKFNIEKEYWNLRGLDYRILTERDATKEYSWNIQFCDSAVNAVFTDKNIHSFLLLFKANWLRKSTLTLQEHMNMVAKGLSISQEQSLELFKFCVLRRLLPIEHDFCIRMFRPINLNICS
jgi:predicted RNA-binding protein with PIN domain